MKKGLGEGEEAAVEDWMRAGTMTGEEKEKEAERGRKEKVQREEEVGVLKEAERVVRRRKVSVCLVGHSSTGPCL